MLELAQPLTDPARLRAVQEVLLAGHDAGRPLDHLARLAAQVLRAAAALISVVDGGCEVLEGSAGLPGPWASRCDFPLEYSFCTRVVATGEPFLVEDARADPRVRDDPAVREMGVISYAGVPLRSDSGQVLGGVCVLDHVPRAWGDDDLRVLACIADTARLEIEQHVLLHRERGEREAVESRFRDELAEASRFRVLVEHSLAGICLLRDERVLYANPRAREIFGFAPGEPLSGVPVAELVVEGERARVLDSVRSVMAGEVRDEPLGFRGLRADGQVVELEMLGARTEAGGGPAIVGTLLDVTDRMRAEEKLRQAAERLQLIERATADVIWEWSVQTGEVVWNGAGPKLFRYRPDEVEGTIDWHLQHVHPDDRERVVGSLHRVLDGLGEFWTQEYRFRRGDGLYVTVLDRGYVQRSGRGEPVHVTGVMMDVTERKRQEQSQRLLSEASALLDSSLDYRAVLASLARLGVPRIGDYCMVDLVEPNGEIRRVATAHADPGREPLLLPGPAGEEQRVPGDSPVARVVATGEHLFIPSADEVRLRELGYPPGVRRAMLGPEHSSVVVVPLSIRSCTLGALSLGTCTSARQLTPLDLMLTQNLAHRIALAVDRARLYEQAQAAVRARDEVLGVVSHDLRSPLNAIQVTATMLQDMTGERRGDNQRWLELIIRSAKHMNGMIEDLLDASSIEAGGFSIQTAESTADALVREALDLLEPIAREKGVRLESAVAGDLPPLLLDARQIVRVITNLVGNATKFTPAGGRVVLAARRDGAEVVFSVTDTGPGIPRDMLPHVFDRFWQARPGDRRGAGLGLTIARGIVEAHGGRIWVEGREGEGAVFHFALPAAPAGE